MFLTTNTQTDKLISIIIPVHNSMAYLKKCVDSCLNQTLDQIEIILVDDASTDDSPKLIEEYALAYPDKIKAIYLKENLRQGAARNRGIMMAQGEYICFVDSDDWIDSDMCEELYKAAVLQVADIVGADYYISNDNTEHEAFLKYKTTDFKTCTIHDIFRYLANNGLFWTRIYKRSLLIDNKIFFPEGIYYEDAYFNFMVVFYAERVFKLNRCFYHYYQSPNSTVRVKNNDKLYDRITIARNIVQDCHKLENYERIKSLVDYKFITMSASNVLYNCLGGFDKPDKQKLEEIRCDVKKFCPEYKYNMYYGLIPSDLRFYLRANMISPKFAIFCYKHNLYLFMYYAEILKNKLHRKRG